MRPSRHAFVLSSACLLAFGPATVSVPLHAASAPTESGPACTAEVSVPGSSLLESVEIERRAASVRFEIVPARFESRDRRVVVREAANRIDVVQPVTELERLRRETTPATTRWVRDWLGGEWPMSPGDRIDLVAAGIDIERVPPGTCLVERFRAPRVSYTEERVLVREPSEQLLAIDAVFETIRRPITSRPAHSRLIEVPTVWSADGSTVERAATLTRVREPASRESVRVARLVRDATVVREPIPAEWDTISIPDVEGSGTYLWRAEGAGSSDEPVLGAAVRDDGTVSTGRRLCHREVPPGVVEYDRLVVREEGRIERAHREAEHVVLEVQALIEDARGERVELPAVVERVERRVPIEAGRVERRPVLCESELTRPVVTALQRALDREGFSPGGIDGVPGPATRDALRRFQEDREIASGAFTIEAVEALGVAR